MGRLGDLCPPQFDYNHKESSPGMISNITNKHSTLSARTLGSARFRVAACLLLMVVFCSVEQTHAKAAPAKSAPVDNAAVASLLEQARIKSEAGDCKGARADIDKALTLDPKSARAYYMRGGCKHKDRDYAGAIADCNTSISISPKPVVYYQRGMSEYRMGDLDNAIRDLDTAIKQLPNFPPSYFYRARAKADKGDRSGAIADCNAYLKLEPNDKIQEFKEYLVSAEPETLREEAQIKQGYEANDTLPKTKLENRPYKFTFHKQNFEITPPPNYSLQRHPSGKMFVFVPPENNEHAGLFSICILESKGANYDGIEEVIAGSLSPFKKNLLFYSAKPCKPLNLSGKAFRGVSYSGFATIIPVTGWSYATEAKDSYFLIMGEGPEQPTPEIVRSLSSLKIETK